MFVLRFCETTGVKSLRPSKEPVRDVDVRLQDGWRTVTASKWMPSNIAYWLEKDLGCRVENQARIVGDFDFDLRWRVGDVTSVNIALAAYGLEIVRRDENQ